MSLRISSWIRIGALLLVATATPARAEWFQREEAIMGTRVAVELWSEDAALAARAMDAVIAEMRRTDELMSTYKPESQLSAVNAHAFEGPVEVDPEIIDVVARSFDFSRMSNGAFDVTYASVGYLYDYRAHQRPTEQQVAAALPGVDYRQVEIDRARNTIRFLRKGVRVDLGGIAKGYAVDRSIEILRGLGIEHAMVNAGGDTRLLGDRLGKPWIVGIRDPRNEGRMVTRLPLEDEAISTSGDYERYFDDGDERCHHLIDPRTGRSPNSIRSVTVIAPDGLTSEALSKTIFVLGVEQGASIVESLPNVDAVIVDGAGALHYTTGLLGGGGRAVSS